MKVKATGTGRKLKAKTTTETPKAATFKCVACGGTDYTTLSPMGSVTVNGETTTRHRVQCVCGQVGIVSQTTR